MGASNQTPVCPMLAKVLTLVLLGLMVPGLNAATAVDADKDYQDQNWAAAEAAYKLLSKEDKNNVTFWYRLGRSELELEKFQASTKSLEQALRLEPDAQLLPSVLLSLARAQAASGMNKAAIESLQSIAQTNSRPYQYVMNANEFENLHNIMEFKDVMERLKPCSEEEYRSFDFWLGEWKVTAPTRPGWSADSIITRGNDGCSIHETYRSQGGYTGNSINFFDRSDQKWHQTWIDNQGGALFLSGNVKEGNMILSDSINRITWSKQTDGQVRQLWETSSDEGKTFSSVFDGYYKRK